jgi:phosphate:Na+ symporter
MSLWMIVNFAGGIGLFLLGMKLMADGFRVAAGETLRAILANWTSSVIRGIVAGVLVTAMVQSSGAVVFAIVGFVNAGLLTLAQAVGVIYGSNVGTTITSWLVAVIGIRLDISLLAMPTIAIGMLLRLTGGSTRRGALGEAVAGFGVFFLGIDVLKTTFAGIEYGMPLEQIAGWGRLGLLAFVGVGVVLTVAMQSSSAALVVTLTAAAGGLVPLEAAAAVVIGANVGATSTAGFAVIGASPSAKRAALAHVVFNVITGVAAFAGLPWLLGLAAELEAGIGLEHAPATLLAVFHTLTKLIGVALLWPLTPRLIRLLEARFRTVEELEGQARHLDRRVASAPALALDAVTLELERMNAITARAAKTALSLERVNDPSVSRDQQSVERLATAVAEFANRVQHAELPPDLADAFPQALRVTQYQGDVAERASALSAMQPGLIPLADAPLAAELARFKGVTVHLLDAALGAVDPEGLDQEVQRFQAEYQDLKSLILRAGTEGRLPIRQMAARLDEISTVRRMVDQAVKAAHYLSHLRGLTRQPQPDAPASTETPTGP